MKKVLICLLLVALCSFQASAKGMSDEWSTGSATTVMGEAANGQNAHLALGLLGTWLRDYGLDGKDASEGWDALRCSWYIRQDISIWGELGLNTRTTRWKEELEGSTPENPQTITVTEDDDKWGYRVGATGEIPLTDSLHVRLSVSYRTVDDLVTTEYIGGMLFRCGELPWQALLQYRHNTNDSRTIDGLDIGLVNKF